MKTLSTSKAPAALGHYSQGIEHNGTIYVSGQIPLYPDNLNLKPETMAEQVTLALQNLLAIVEAGGGKKESILKVTIFLSDLSLWPEANEAFATFFGDHKPARTAVPAPAIPKDCLVEINAIAAVMD